MATYTNNRTLLNKVFITTTTIMVIALVVFNLFYITVTIESNSMQPTLKHGDFLIMKRPALSTALHRGALVLFDTHGKNNVLKRIIGVPGDLITMQGKTVFITKRGEGQLTEMSNTVISHGQIDQDGYPLSVYKTELDEVDFEVAFTGVVPTYEAHYFKQSKMPTGQWFVPKNHYFVMGDNRDFSIDSRFFGFVSNEVIKGVFNK